MLSIEDATGMRYGCGIFTMSSEAYVDPGIKETTLWEGSVEINWGDNAEDQVVAQFDLTEETPNPFEFTYTEANKTIVDERGGMLIVGYGYRLTKVTTSK